MRLIFRCILAFAAICSSEILGGADRAVHHPEQLSGEWESQDASGGAVGITLQLTTTASGNVTTLAQVPQKFEALKIGVYRRARLSVAWVTPTGWIPILLKSM
jgi:hypothetical protein